MKIIISFYILLIVFSIYAYNYEPNRQYINPKECTETKWRYYFEGRNHYTSIFKCRSSSHEVDSIKFDYSKDGYCYYTEYHNNGALLSANSDGITVMDKDRSTILKVTSEAYGLKVSCDILLKEFNKEIKQ